MICVSVDGTADYFHPDFVSSHSGKTKYGVDIHRCSNLGGTTNIIPIISGMVGNFEKY